MSALKKGAGYQFHVRRRGNTTPLMYVGVFVAQQGDTLLFASLENSCTIRVAKELLDGEPIELGAEQEGG